MAQQAMKHGEQVAATAGLRSVPQQGKPILLPAALPTRQTSFVGRTNELTQLISRLTAPDCRLITIIGPGGSGKTRLALETARAAQAQFPDGVAFATLATAPDATALASAIATAVGCPLVGRTSVPEQVLHYLRTVELLLILDNFEHLLAAGPWLSALLTAAPGVSLLVTSRTALNLREEWRYPLAGLAIPEADDRAPEQTEAAHLFIERAQQVRPDFSPVAERAGLGQICRLVDGLPLALELAAAWVKTLSCTAIAEEIARNLAFLTTDLRNAPDRHRSMQAVFDHSWALLTTDEQRIFQRLAVFRGGFRREAAAQVAGATLPLLSALTDASLLRYEPDGRFSLHELLRQYAEAHLDDTPAEAAQTADAHRRYYLAYLAAQFAPIIGGAQREAVAAITAELANILAAWRATAAHDPLALGQVAHTMTVFYDIRARYLEGLALLQEGLQAVRPLPPTPATEQLLAALLVDIARFHHRLFQPAAMRAALTESEAYYARLAIPPPSGQGTDPLLWRGILALLAGRYIEAELLGNAAVARNTPDRPGNLSLAWWICGRAALWQQAIRRAEDYTQQAAETAVANGDRWHLAYCHNLQGHIAIAREDYATARQQYQASYALREEFNDPEGMATSLTHLAKIAAHETHWAEAEHLFRRSLAFSRAIGDQAAVVNILNGLGNLTCAIGNYATAGNYFAEGLRLALATHYARLIVVYLTSIGEWLTQTAQPALAATVYACAATAPASDHDTRTQAQQRLDTAAAALPPADYSAAVALGHNADPVALATRIVPILTLPLPTPPPAAPATLVEPLTAREQAVLALIAAGYSNRKIADELFLTVNTVRSYTHHLYNKLAVSSRTHAVARARELGLLP